MDGVVATEGIGTAEGREERFLNGISGHSWHRSVRTASAHPVTVPTEELSLKASGSLAQCAASSSRSVRVGAGRPGATSGTHSAERDLRDRGVELAAVRGQVGEPDDHVLRLGVGVGLIWTFPVASVVGADHRRSTEAVLGAA